MDKPTFGVAHETANNSADAEAHVRYFQNYDVRASYHQLADSDKIIEIVPTNEQAGHVRRDMDRQTLGLGRANDRALAISICRTGNFAEAYDRYVWAWAKACVDYGWDPKKKITAHSFEDPTRRSDPQSWLGPNGVSWNKFLDDVDKYVKAWNSETEIQKPKAEHVSMPTGNEDLIQHGDSGDHVVKLQERLIAAGFDLPRFGADGQFGDETEKALIDFQRAAKITVDGLFGPQSSSVLDNFKTEKTSQSRPGKPKRKASLTLDGKWASATTKALQKSLGTVQDGEISNQPRNNVTESLYGGVTFGSGGSMVVRALQKKVGSTADGLLGPNTIRALQKYLVTPQDGVISRPSSMMVKEMQRQLNNGSF
ncbi:N-acetylmuramoyl-L-alanine amidase [Salipaludibacillus sp. HK11]|uniref:peptidoglycan recognition protein family protein n=1 Tax=Salipaludibacillus sp. HK11 TaxID=3394320 RepID=UPI0039FC2C0A